MSPSRSPPFTQAISGLLSARTKQWSVHSKATHWTELSSPTHIIINNYNGWSPPRRGGHSRDNVVPRCWKEERVLISEMRGSPFVTTSPRVACSSARHSTRHPELRALIKYPPSTDKRPHHPSQLLFLWLSTFHVSLCDVNTSCILALPSKYIQGEFSSRSDVEIRQYSNRCLLEDVWISSLSKI